jgi:hypothetical protein
MAAYSSRQICRLSSCVAILPTSGFSRGSCYHYTAPGIIDVSCAAMKLNWKSVQAAHVNQACEALFNSRVLENKPRGLVVIYKDRRFPAKTVLRMAYCLANNIPLETKLKFASSEGSLQLLRTLGFRAERLEITTPLTEEH